MKTILSVASSIDLSLSSLDIAMTVLDAAIDRAASCEESKAESAAESMWQQEVQYINKLITAAYILMKEPMEKLEDIRGTAYQLAKAKKEAAPV